MARFPGAKTELYSEVIGQICLAFAIDKSRPIKASDFNIEQIKKLMPYMVFHSKANFSDSTFVRELIEYGMDDVSKGLPFVVAQGKNMNKLRKDLKITKQHKIYNDKLYGNTPNRDNP